MDAVAFRDVSLRLAGRTILGAMTFSIASREFVGVLGSNGAGKTTLLRAVLGLVKPSEGEVTVLGRPATRGNANIGYMPQLRGAVANLRLSGRDFVGGTLNGHRLGLPVRGKASRSEVDRVLALVDANELARRAVGELSGGERQRLLLAQALIGNPRLLLLDEPLISLDPRHQAEVVDMVKGIQSELGIAVLFSAHEINPLLGVLDRVLYLGGGYAAIGAVDEVITSPILSRLYGAEIDVVHVNGRIFVMSGRHDVQRDAHRHNGLDSDETTSLPRSDQRVEL